VDRDDLGVGCLREIEDEAEDALVGSLAVQRHDGAGEVWDLFLGHGTRWSSGSSSVDLGAGTGPARAPAAS
jgi:hypothetical protein